MNTPAHLVLNSVVLGRRGWRSHWLPIALGALLPDLPMILFYLYERGMLGTPERTIWLHAYFEPSWQASFDLFNSIPLIAIGALVAWRNRSTAWLAFFSSMALHCLSDLPVHREDAHAHFFPFTSWHFESPVSYWDPAHHGLVFAGAEALLVLGGVALLWRFPPPRAWRFVGAASALIYLLLGGIVLTLWVE